MYWACTYAFISHFLLYGRDIMTNILMFKEYKGDLSFVHILL